MNKKFQNSPLGNTEMDNNSGKRGKKVGMKKLGLGGATVAALMGITALPAMAADPIIPDGSTGSLTIHKYEQPVNYGDDNYGMELSGDATADLDPLAGATFQIQRVTEVDLTTNAGWVKAQTAVDDFDPFNATNSLTSNGFGLANAQSKVTSKTGIAQFTNLPVGLYLVQETKTPEVGANEAVTASMPFLITVPLTDPADLHQWVYNVHAYPKNVISSVEKTVVDNPAYGLGDTVEWSIESTIPRGAETTKYVVTDKLDSKLKYESTTVFIDGKATTDFTAVLDSATNTVTTTLGATARSDAYKALQANANATIVTKHVTTVIKSGEIANDATLTFQRDGEPETDVPSTMVETKFGGINIFKHDREGNALEGAVFEVRAARVNDFSKATAVAINGITSWATDTNGKIALDGLRYSDFADGEAVTENSGKYNFYWLVEIKAPAGYELLAKPIAFTITDQVTNAITVDVVNTPHNAGASLPKTGAEGTVTILLVASGLLTAGIVGMGVARRKSSK